MSSSTDLNVSYAFNAWGQRNLKFPVNADNGANDHQEVGRMQLVDATIHMLTGHTGGWSLWGKLP
jgi:agmatine/peptidylarginine deiminase